MVEREIKLEVRDDFRMPDLSGVAAGVVVRGEPEEIVLDATYYDAFDLRLLRRGITLRHRSDGGWTLKISTGDRRSLSRHEIVLDGAAGQVPEQAVDILRAHLGRETLGEVGSLHTARRRTLLRDGGGGELAEVVEDEVTPRPPLGRKGGPWRELEVELRPAGDEMLLGRVAEVLRDAGARRSRGMPKLVRAVGRETLGEIATIPEARGTTDAIVRAREAIESAVSRFLAHDPLVVLDVDPEDVHQTRVGLRRLRTHLRNFRPVLARPWADDLRREIRWFARLLGDVRDLDVMQATLAASSQALGEDERAALRAIETKLGSERTRTHERLLLARRESRFAELAERLAEAAASPPLAPEAEAVRVERLMRRPARRVGRAVKAVGRPPADPDLHRVRRRARDLRFAGEALAPSLGRPAARLAGAAEGLQDVLGEHQDAVVLRERLRLAAEGTSWRTGLAAGELSARQTAIAEEARADADAAWRRVKRRRRRLRRATRT
jgi:CHAD domain-containing protein